MLNLQELLSKLPAQARDSKINLQSVLNKENNVLDERQIFLVALASAYQTQNQDLILAITNEAQNILSETEIAAAKIAASIMAMNTIYYRFTHLVEGGRQYLELPAGLRMQGISNHGIDKISFEAMSLAIAALEGCGMCLSAHEKTLTNEGFSKVQIQMVIKIAAVINAVNKSLNLQ